MSAPQGTEGRFPTWARDATSATLRERRDMLHAPMERLAESLRAATFPAPVEVERLQEDLVALPEATPWLDRGGALSVAREQRDAHIAAARRGRRIALGLAAMVLVLAVAGPLSRRSEPLAPGERTQLVDRTLHSSGDNVVLAGRGAVTLLPADPSDNGPVIVLHEGEIEVAARGAGRVTVQVGPHAVQVAGGRFHVERAGGAVRVQAAEGRVLVVGPDGETVALEPGDPSWESPPPELVETCSGEPEQVAPPGSAPGAPDAADPAGSPRAMQVTAGATASRVPVTLRLGPEPAELGVGGRTELVELQAAHEARAPTVDLQVTAQPWESPWILPTTGGTRGALGGVPSPSAPPPPPVGSGAGGGATGLSSTAAAAVALPELVAAHEIAHTLQGEPVPTRVDPESGLGYCPMPDPLEAPPPVPRPETAPTPVAASAPPASARSPRTAAAPPSPEAAGPTRQIPTLPGGGAAPAAPAPPERGPDALAGVVFGPGIDALECEP